jgi:hypothetical protein
MRISPCDARRRRADGAPPLKLLDEASRADHIHLVASDRCSILAHYQSGGGYRGSRCNRLIRNYRPATIPDPEALRLRPLRERILLFEDLLTSGKHYKCCERRLTQALTGVPIAGCF